MATSVVIPNTYGLATYRWTWIPAGKEFTVTMGYRDTALADDPTAAALSHYQYLTATGSVCVAASMSTDWRFEGVTVLQRLSGGLLQTGAKLTPITGTASTGSSINPVFVTWVVSKRTAFAGRQYRGRMYPPFLDLAESQVDYNGVINGGSVTTNNTRWNTYFTNVNITAYQPYLLHAAPKVGATPAPTPITAISVGSVAGIQRRRRARA